MRILWGSGWPETFGDVMLRELPSASSDGQDLKKKEALAESLTEESFLTALAKKAGMIDIRLGFG